MNHYFTNNTNLESNIKVINVKVKDTNLQFYTDNGVFSKKGLDFGTRSLLLNLPVTKMTGQILDFGCGYGPIGIYLAKTTRAFIDMIDINTRSIKLAIANAKLNKTSNVTVYSSDVYSHIDKKYDYIVSNPPIRVGKKILYEILFKASEHLVSGGELWIVVNKNQGAKTIIKDLEKEYSVKLVDKNKGFYIICATKIDNLE